ncbi:MAG TPA: MFS transporter [Vicinamibacterales bacterium]|nr:MFS transporter [Vicinamibacterales bacterium]
MTTSARTAGTINISDVLGNSTIGPLHMRVFVLTMASLIMDGFDVQAMSYVAPAVVADWGIGRDALRYVFPAANAGVLVGSLVFSVVADKIGRRPVLVGATLFFAVMSLATATAQDVTQLLWLRFIAGIGMGCIIPNSTALIGEFSPARLRVTLMMCITVGFTAGAAIGGFVAAWMIPAFGWRSVFVFGGAVPLVVALAMLWGLPESLQFLAVRRRSRPTLVRWLKELDPRMQVDDSTQLIAQEQNREGAPFVHLFRDGRGASTILLWVINFMNLLVLYSVTSWLPLLINAMGYETRTAVLIGAVLQTGGTIGAFGLAWLIARGGFMPMLTGTFAVATLSIAFIGQPGLSLTALGVIVFVAGWCVIGGQPGINALSATYYPTSLRSTGIGWGLGIGRIGAIVGPYIGGVLIGQKWTEQQLFWAAAAPALVTTLTFVMLSFTMKLPEKART